jgi:hypothetical protein
MDTNLQSAARLWVSPRCRGRSKTLGPTGDRRPQGVSKTRSYSIPSLDEGSHPKHFNLFNGLKFEPLKSKLTEEGR